MTVATGVARCKATAFNPSHDRRALKHEQGDVATKATGFLPYSTILLISVKGGRHKRQQQDEKGVRENADRAAFFALSGPKFQSDQSSRLHTNECIAFPSHMHNMCSLIFSENGGAIFDHASGGIVLLRAA